MAAGKPHDIKPTGPSDIRRIEAGILNWGADITLAETPYHVGLERLVDRQKPADYVGRDALRRVKEKGVDRKLVGVEIAGERIAFNPTKWPVSAAGRPAGHITSALYSPRLKKNIGYAMVPAAHAQPGTTLSVTIPEMGARAATVVAMPFVDPTKEIPKG
jgi:aminomethyltransferase